jgi:hypothetical protein
MEHCSTAFVVFLLNAEVCKCCLVVECMACFACDTRAITPSDRPSTFRNNQQNMLQHAFIDRGHVRMPHMCFFSRSAKKHEKKIRKAVELELEASTQSGRGNEHVSSVI